MSENQEKTIDFGEEIIGWNVPEYIKHERSKNWYTIAIIGAFLLLLYSFLSANFLFAIIVIIGALVIILHDGQEPEAVRFSITDEGLMVGSKFYDYDEIRNFSVIYKPKMDVRRLYFEFKGALRPRLSISLEDMDPLPIRENLLKYLEEDLERTDQPLSEALAKRFKL